MRIITCFIALFFSNLLSAQIEFDGEWILSSSKENVEFYVLNKPKKEDFREPNDYFSKYYQDSEKNLVKVWVKEEFLVPKEKFKNKLIHHRISLVEFDLFSAKVRTMEIISYDKEGIVLNHDEYNSYQSDWSNLIPNTIGFGLLKTTQEIIEQIQIIDVIISIFKTNNKNKIANIISYPLYREFPIPEIKNSQEMISRFEEVFDDAFIRRIATSNSNDWSRVGWRGVMFDNGELWLNEEGKIAAVNYQTQIEKNRHETFVLRDKNIIHESIKNYIEPILVGITDDYRFRIDLIKEQESIDDLSFRLTVWNRNERMCDKPIAILLGTEDHGSEQISFYEFKNGEMRYTYDEIYFAIDNNDQEILSQEVTILSPSFLEKERIEIEEEIKERKKQIEFANLCQSGDNFVTENKLKKGLTDYQKAHNLYSDNAILNNKIIELKENIKRIESLHNQRNEAYSRILQLRTELINDSTTTLQLLEIKKTISKSYALCISSFMDSLNLNLKKYNSKIVPMKEETLVWSDADQESLQIINSTLHEMEQLFLFRKIVTHLICLGDKKTLKKLTDSTVMSETIAAILTEENVLSIDCINSK